MKKAIVIGATSGIGREFSKLLADDGYIVGITGRRTELLNTLKQQKPENFICKTFDITDTEKSVTALNELVSELGHIDLILISSGIGDINHLLDYSIEKRTIDTNVLGFTCVADWAYNFFEKQKSGHLAAVSSIGGIRGTREAPAYNASKAYQINYLEALRQKAAKSKQPIYVTDLQAGLINTAMAKGDGLFWVEPLDKAVKQMYRAVMKRKKVAYITKRWGIIAVLLKIIPKFIYDRM